MTNQNTKPLAHGHRKRLKDRFLKGGHDAIADYELLELLLFGANLRKDTKPIAKQLLADFGSFGQVLNASTEDLLKIPGMGEGAAAIIRAVSVSCDRILLEKIIERPLMTSWNDVVNHIKKNMQNLQTEQFRILFLDSKNRLTHDEVQQTGTINHVPIYPREVAKRAIELGAAAIIMVHNHPSGDPTPSADDIEITKAINQITKSLGIRLHDHIIVGGNRYLSFRSEGLLI